MKSLAWVSWLGIIAAVVGFFVLPIWLGVIAVVLGIIGLAGKNKALAWIAIVLGVIAWLLPLIL